MKILGIETSCDETAIAVLEIAPRPIRRTHNKQARGEEITVLSNVISSQVKLHAKYGGVVPNLAAREHVKNIGHVFKLALKEAGIKNFDKEIDLIAVTRGPGLGPSLLVGLAFARTIAWKYDKPLVGVNHLEGHIYSNWLQPIAVSTKSQIPNPKQTRNLKFKIQNIFPVLNLIVSGGHTELVLMSTDIDPALHGSLYEKGRSASGGEPQIKYKIIGETLDDAAGEAFDKVARLLGLGYPGGPAIAKRASQWNIDMSKFRNVEISFPRPMINSKNYNFSYAGLKTAVLYKVRDLKNAGVKLTDNVINQICYEFQKAALDVLVEKTVRFIKEYKAEPDKAKSRTDRQSRSGARIKSLFLSGGVSANKELRKRLGTEAKKIKIKYSQPEMEYTGDNAAMIAVAGYFSSRNKKPQDLTWDKAEMNANLGF